MVFPRENEGFRKRCPKSVMELRKCKTERAETKLKKRPKKLLRKPVLKALRRLNLITVLLVYDFRKMS